MCNTLQNPKIVLSALSENSKKNENYEFKRLYRNLYNPEFYYMAYKEMSPKEGNMTKGTDGNTIDGMSLTRIESLINKLKNKTYSPNPVRRQYINKKGKGNKKRPLGIPSIDDKMVQYVIKYILESIYECKFSNHSHGFRPMRSCHTALYEIKKDFKGVKWFVEGDIRGFFDNIDHHILINILRKNIKDEYFLGLIWKFLKAGYVEEWKFNKTYSGTPQGGIISPIMANIYLNELDSYMNEIKTMFEKDNSVQRKTNIEYTKISSQIRINRIRNKKMWSKRTQEERKEAERKLKELIQQRVKIPLYDPNERYVTVKYVRYADDFIVGINGSKEDAKRIKSLIKEMLWEKLRLELSEEKTLITHSSNYARFLGYDIAIRRCGDLKRDKDNKLRKSFNYSVCYYVPHEVWRNRLLQLKALEIKKNQNGKEQWIAKSRTELTMYDDLEIINNYNATIRGYYNYYQYANNSTVLQKFKYILEYSMYKTFAQKYKTTMRKVINKHSINGIFAVKYKTKKGQNCCYLYNEGFKHKSILKNVGKKDYDIINQNFQSNSRNSLIERLQLEVCEMCGKNNVPLEMHHVKKLKNLKGKEQWEIVMISRKRKTLAVCHECHIKITNQQRNS